jgi:protein Tex
MWRIPLAVRLVRTERIEVAMTATTESGEVPTEREQGAPVIEVSRVVPFPIDQVWQILITPAGAEALLGDGAKLGTKGEPWRSVDGSHGVVRSYHPMEQVRLTWHADEHAAATLVDLRLTSEDGGTRLDLRHERVNDAALGQSLSQRWEEALSRFSGPA